MCGLKIKTRETITVKLANSYLDFLCCENLNITPSNQLSVEFFSLHTNEIKMAVVVELHFLVPLLLPYMSTEGECACVWGCGGVGGR